MWMKDYFQFEANENPEWSQFLQGSNLSKRRIARLDKEILHSSEVLVGSSFVRKTFTGFLQNEKKLRVLPLGVDTADLGQLSKLRDWNDSPLRILFVGQLNQRKGISYLLEGFKRAGLGGSAKLTLVGGTSMGKSILSQILRYENVEIVDHVSRSELGRILSSHHLYVLPSLAEGFPLSAIEAMSSGLPVVISHNTFGDDVIIDGLNGFLVPARDANAIAKIIGILSNNRDKLKELSENGKITAEKFTWTNYCTELLTIFSEEVV
jgi:glycosyltransferase involved in cell wall biosynthesis